MMACQGINPQGKRMLILQARFDSTERYPAVYWAFPSSLRIWLFPFHLYPFSYQYKVFRDGCWTKIAFKKDEPQLYRTNKSGAVLASPWIKHYKSAGRHQVSVNSDQQGNATLVKQIQSPASDFGLCHKDYVTGSWDFQSAHIIYFPISISSH